MEHCTFTPVRPPLSEPRAEMTHKTPTHPLLPTSFKCRTLRLTVIGLLVLAALGCEQDPGVGSSTSALDAPASVRTRSGGVLASGLEVGPDGAAEFTIPIQVVPGRSQMQPSLSVSYTSNDALGLLGRGFGLRGVSTITRCARTPATDGYTRSVQYDNEDAYCLDGERLVELEDHNTYVDYRTERESFRLVRMFRGPNEMGPKSWRVRAPNGVTYWYGEETANRPISDTETLAEWMVGRVEDSFGNGMSFEWEAPLWPAEEGPRGAIAEVRLGTIAYTSHTSGLTADRFVRFSYDRHAFVEPSYAAGLATHRSGRVRRISTAIGSKSYREYRFEYDESAATSASLLRSATECVVGLPEDGTSLDEGMICRPPTEFEWETPDSDENFSVQDVQMVPRAAGFYANILVDDNGHAIPGFPLRPAYSVVLDANGDGASDIAFVSGDRLYLMLADASSDNPFATASLDNPFATAPIATSRQTLEQVHSYTRGYQVIDWNSDGLDDLLYLSATSNGWQFEVRVMLSTGTDFTERRTGLFYTEAITRTPFDPASDGGNGGDFATHVPAGSHGLLVSEEARFHHSPLKFADFNGDGLTDALACEVEHERNCPNYWSNGVSTPACNRGQWSIAWGERDHADRASFGPRYLTGLEYPCGYYRFGAAGGFPVGDATGDGVADVFVPRPDRPYNYAVVTYDRDAAEFQMRDAEGLNWGASADAVDPMFVDVNGDGLQDLLMRHANPHLTGLDRPRDSFSTYVRGYDADWETQVYYGQGQNTFAMRPSRYPAGWGDLNREVSFRFARCDGGGVTCDDKRYTHLMSPRLPIDLSGSGRLDVVSFAQNTEDRFWTDIDGGYDGWNPRTPFVIPSQADQETYIDPSDQPIASPIFEESGQGAAGVIRPWLDVRILQGDFNADGHDDYIELPMHTVLSESELPVAYISAPLRLNNRAIHERVIAITDGMALRDEIAYATTGSSDVYTHGDAIAPIPCRWPQRCDATPKVVVQELRRQVGTDAEQRHTYHYWDSRVDTQGRGWLGFGRRTETDWRTGAVELLEFSHGEYDEATHSFPLAGRVSRRVVLLHGDTSHPFEPKVDTASFPDESSSMVATVETTSFHYQRYGNRIAVVPNVHRVDRYEYVVWPFEVPALDHIHQATPISTTITRRYYDDLLAYGLRHLPTEVRVQHPLDWDGKSLSQPVVFGQSDAATTTTTAEYKAPPSGEDDSTKPWRVGRVQWRRVQNDGSPTAQTNCGSDLSFRAEYDSSTGSLERVIRQPDEFAPGRSSAVRASEWLEQSIERDDFGHIKASTLRDATGEERTTVSAYEAADGYTYLRQSENAVGHTTQYIVREEDGSVLGTVDANSLTHWTLRDAFGEVRQVREPGEPTVFLDRETRYSALGTPEGEIATVTRAGAGYANTITNALGQVVARQWLARDESGGASEASVRFEYNSLGQLERRTSAAFAGGTRSAIHIERDVLGEVRRVTDMRGQIRHRTRKPLLRFEENAVGEIAVTEFNAAGQVIRSRGHGENDSMEFNRCVDGRLRNSIDPLGNVNILEYDRLGRRTNLQDVDQGKTHADFNAFGEVLRTIDAEDRVAVMKYDQIGRLVSRNTSAGEMTLQYDDPGALGFIAYTESEDEVTQFFEYDEHLRLQGRTQSVDGINYRFAYKYDSLGRLTQTTYPTINSYGRLVVRNHYDPDHGGLERVDSPQVGALWEVTSENADGQILEEQFGNGFRSERDYEQGTGLLSHVNTYGRADGSFFDTSVQDWSYSYDAEGRLEKRKDGTHGFSETYGYTASGQLDWASPSDCESPSGALGCTVDFEHDVLGNLIRVSGGTTSSGVMEYDGDQPHAVSRFQGRDQYYDRTGNHLSESGSFGSPARRHVTYDGRNLPVRIEDHHTGHEVLFRYDALGQRAASDGPDGFRVYFGDYERRGDVEVSQVSVGSVHIALNRHWKDPKFEVSYQHIGRRDSVEATTGVIDGTTQVLQISNYAPFGEKRELSWTQEDPRGFAGTDAGFGGHEEEDAGGLIAMGARGYDPAMRHMTSPDPYVVAPHSVIGYNRYAYAFNDPINYNDPTGLQQATVGNAENRASDQASQAEQRMLARLRQQASEVCTTVNGSGVCEMRPAYATVTVGGESEPLLGSDLRRAFDDSIAAQFLSGAAAGGLAGAAPGGFLASFGAAASGAVDEVPQSVGVGYAAGEILWGFLQMAGGSAGVVGGGALAVAGGGATATGVGAPAGVAAMAGGAAVVGASTLVVAEGAADVLGGFSVLWAAMSGGGGGGGGGAAAAAARNGSGGSGVRRIIADNDVLVAATNPRSPKHAAAMSEITSASEVFITPNQLNEFTHFGGISRAQRHARQQFLRDHNIQVLDGQALAQNPEFQRVFEAVRGAQGRGDAALVGASNATGIEAVTFERRLENFVRFTNRDRSISAPRRLRP